MLHKQERRRRGRGTGNWGSSCFAYRINISSHMSYLYLYSLSYLYSPFLFVFAAEESLSLTPSLSPLPLCLSSMIFIMCRAREHIWQKAWGRGWLLSCDKSHPSTFDFRNENRRQTWFPVFYFTLFMAPERRIKEGEGRVSELTVRLLRFRWRFGFLSPSLFVILFF